MEDHPFSASGESLYRVLELPKGSTKEDIKRKYRQLALRFHPDKNLGDPQSAEKFKEINRAHSILSDEGKKEIYDRYGSLGLFLADKIGAENLRCYFAINSWWCKALCCFGALLTGCYCCLCCCACCNFCCGKCEPKDDEENLVNPDDIDAEVEEFLQRFIEEVRTENPDATGEDIAEAFRRFFEEVENTEASSSSATPIVTQPSTSAAAFAMPPPESNVSENTRLTQGAQKSYAATNQTIN